MIREFKDYTADSEEKCDVCVIGSGAGGAVVAKELAEKGHDVVLVEEGSYYRKEDWSGKPLEGLRMWRNGGGTIAAGLPSISVTLGRCIGGTTTVNSATCFRTPEKIMEAWQRDLGIDTVSTDTMEPYFQKVEKEINVTELSWDVLGNCAAIIRRGAEKLGLTCRPLKHNVKNCQGCGTCQFGCLEGAKQSTDVSYIPKALAAGARVYANCRADRILKKKGRVTGLVCSFMNPATDRPAGKMTITAPIVVVACGSMITPSFLKKNGIRNRHIGRHLQIHPCTRAAAIMDEKVEGWKGVSQGAYIDDFEDEGIMLEGIFVHPSILLAAFPKIGHEFKENAAQFAHLAAFGIMVHDSTTGRVYRGIKDFIFSRYFMKKSDAEKLKRGIAYTARIFFAAGARKVLTPIAKMPVLESESDVEKLLAMKMKPALIAEGFAFHPLGSARMASTRRLGVVNTKGESFDLENLYIADGSIVPTSLGVNPQVTIMSLATMIADNIAEKIAAEPERSKA